MKPQHTREGVRGLTGREIELIGNIFKMTQNHIAQGRARNTLGHD